MANDRPYSGGESRAGWYMKELTSRFQELGVEGDLEQVFAHDMSPGKVNEGVEQQLQHPDEELKQDFF